MKIKLKAFPVTYFTVKCKKHDCWVEIRPQMTRDREDTLTVGGRLTALKCEVGGSAQHSRCVDDWEITISGPGDVTVSA